MTTGTVNSSWNAPNYQAPVYSTRATNRLVPRDYVLRNGGRTVDVRFDNAPVATYTITQADGGTYVDPTPEAEAAFSTEALRAGAKLVSEGLGGRGSACNDKKYNTRTNRNYGW